MLHPAGMALFGEFNITNNYDLSIALESLVKSLGIGLEDTQGVVDTGITTIGFGKVLSSTINTPTDSAIKSVSKVLATSYSGMSDSNVMTFTKPLATSYSGMSDSNVMTFTKPLATSYSGTQDAISTRAFSKALATSQSIADIPAITTTKYLTDTLDSQTESGYIALNPYAAQDYFDDSDYSAGARASTFTTP
jgi:hypothetical protein